MKTNQLPIGQMKAKAIAKCTICCCSIKRNISEFVYENTPEAIEKAKAIITQKAKAEYTCRICKSIKRMA